MALLANRVVGGGNRRTGVVLFFASVVIATTLSVAARQQIGYVVSVRGEWFLNDSSQKLKPGTPDTAGGRVRAREPRGGDYIEIADRRGRIIANRSCNSNGCGQPITLPANSSGLASRLFGAAMALMSNDPAKFAVLISRGGEFREAVLQLVGEQVDLSPVLADKGKGSYLLRFEPKGAAGQANAKIIGPVRVDWEPGRPAPVTVKGLAPGLYVAQPLDNDDREPLEPGSESWVLVTRPDKFDKAYCDFLEARAITQEWGDSVRQSSKRQFLRAALGQLEAEGR